MSIKNIKLEFFKDTAQRIENVSDEDYFGEAYKDYVSNSMLKLINPDEGGAPTRFLSGFEGGSKSGALELGSAVHQMILEREKYFLSPVDKPTGKIGLICDSYHVFKQVESLTDEEALLEACKEHDYYKGKLTEKKLEEILLKGKEYLDFLDTKTGNPGVIVLTDVQKEKLDGCLESVKNNKIILDLLVPPTEDKDGNPLDIHTFNEDVMTMKFQAVMPVSEDNLIEEVLDYQIKAKIDNWSIDFDNKVLTLNDLKTTGRSVHEFAGLTYEGVGKDGNTYSNFKSGSFQKYHYYRQMAMYAFILVSYAEKMFAIDKSWTIKVNMLVVETNKPYISHVFSVGQGWLKAGMTEFKNLLSRVSYHKMKGFDKFIEMDLSQITEI